MASFAHNVFDALADLQAKCYFVPARFATYKRFASLVRHVSDDVFAYVLVRDDRPDGANLDVDLWLAPPDYPDDSLERLGVGYKISIGSKYTIDDSYFEGCCKRIVDFMACAPSIAPIVNNELRNPAIRTRRHDVYQVERLLLPCVYANTSLFEPHIGRAQRIVEDIIVNGDIELLHRVCLPIAKDIRQQDFLDSSAWSIWPATVESLASSIATQLILERIKCATT